MRKFLLIVLLAQLANCQYKPDAKAVELVKQANKIGSESFYKDTIKANQALDLLNKAIEIDDKYFSAYYSKSIFLTTKKDINGLLLNNQKMIELRPNQPLWLIQRGLFFDIKKDSKQAQENYALGITKYRELLKQKDLNQDFNLRIEYISALEISSQLKQAKIEIEKLQKDFPENEIVQTYAKGYKLKSKAELLNIWRNGDTETKSDTINQ
ncbi:tetratricopeptide repeat protein [Flavobacterium mesophilum]|uniref:tetratricopeptide repeat protein n=1 Tax=Flavobacterium mesophilum TaxID=3143495 RepID=UPI0031D048EE